MKLLQQKVGGLIAGSENIQKILMNVHGKGIRILYYHIVGDHIPDHYFKDRGVKTNEFRNQLRFFKKKFQFISLTEAYNRSLHKESLDRYIVLTTDDGFIENYTTVVPILVDEKIPATFFLISNCIDNKDLMWRNKLIFIYNKLGEDLSTKLCFKVAQKQGIVPPIKKENILLWSQRTFSMNKKDLITNIIWNESGVIPIKEYLEKFSPYMSINNINEIISGGFEIGSHTISHPYCDKLDFNEMEQEIIGSIDKIEEKIGKEYCFSPIPLESRETKILKVN